MINEPDYDKNSNGEIQTNLTTPKLPHGRRMSPVWPESRTQAEPVANPSDRPSDGRARGHVSLID